MNLFLLDYFVTILSPNRIILEGQFNSFGVGRRRWIGKVTSYLEQVSVAVFSMMKGIQSNQLPTGQVAESPK